MVPPAEERMTTLRRGLMRAWLVLSALWIAACVAFAVGSDYSSEDTSDIAAVALCAVVPPLVLLGLGEATAWVMKGLRWTP